MYGVVVVVVVLRQDKQNEVLVTNSLLNEKQMGLEQIRGAVKRAEHESEQEGERVKGVCRESGQVMLAINNLHTRYNTFILGYSQSPTTYTQVNTIWGVHVPGIVYISK